MGAVVVPISVVALAVPPMTGVAGVVRCVVSGVATALIGLAIVLFVVSSVIRMRRMLWVTVCVFGMLGLAIAGFGVRTAALAAWDLADGPVSAPVTVVDGRYHAGRRIWSNWSVTVRESDGRELVLRIPRRDDAYARMLRSSSGEVLVTFYPRTHVPVI